MIAHQKTVFTASAKGYALYPLRWGCVLKDRSGQGAELARPWLEPNVVQYHPYHYLLHTLQ